MSDYPLVVILLLTHNRTEYALRTIKQTMENIYYPNLKWYVADSGSEGDHFDTVCDFIGDDTILRSHKWETSPGKSWNLGVKRICSNAEIYLRLLDIVLSHIVRQDLYGEPSGSILRRYSRSYC